MYLQRTPAAKKSKPADSSSTSVAAKKAAGKSDSDTLVWDLDKSKRVTLREFKGKWYVDIREFYMADGDMKPGKKGISLQLTQWHKLKEIVEDVDAAIKKHV